MRCSGIRFGLLQDHHLKSGYQLLYTPHVAKAEMWKTSGHLDFYAENMFDRIKVGLLAAKSYVNTQPSCKGEYARHYRINV